MVGGCATNIAASNQLTEYLDFLSPSIRCVAHAADGSAKRMTNSKTMNFPDLSEFIPTLKVILRHFQWKKHCPFKRGPWNDGYEDHSHDDILPYSDVISSYCINLNCQFTCSTLWCPCHSKYQRRREKPLHVTKRNDSCSLACWFEKYFLQKLFKNLRLSWWPYYFFLPNFNGFCWKKWKTLKQNWLIIL